MSELERILGDIQAAADIASTRKNWQPDRQGSIDIRIAADGRWYHEGRLFQRDALTRLFAGILRREGVDYYLVTPAEKLRIQVDDAPFVATLVDKIEEDDLNALVFTTNLEERVIADQQHPIRVEIDSDSQQPRPYIHVRDGLEALIGRNAFFELVNMASCVERDGRQYLSLTSMDTEFILGPADENSQ